MNHAGDQFGSTESDSTDEHEDVDSRDCLPSSLGRITLAMIE